ncbi:DUF6369 family protein [Photobacterium sp. WH77]|uniref:DUF6369 family protein n=1 Tax=unclassified Photobacterium TaxID=2628852 RepID=UPI001ED9F4F9|nr:MULTISPECIES: DUF6369 family protein [unclassified Photobacterium]MCG2835702.1 DUF6369 family protein [Photobacterium sp. WH77]MCG2843315.1 DUF6369 family protein [Photobacterium sp. WH80]
MLYLSFFILLTSAFFINNRKRLFYFVLALLLILPSSLQFGSLVYVSGVYWVDILTLVLSIYCLLSLITSQHLIIDRRYLSLFIPIVIIFIYSLSFFYRGFDEVESLKDYRPLLFFLIVITFGFLTSNLQIYSSLLNAGVKVCLISVLVWGGFSYFGLLNSDDRFYQPEFRYLGLQTYFCLFYLIFSFSKRDVDIKHIFLAYIVIIVSMSRMLLGLSIIPLLVWFFVSSFTIRKMAVIFFMLVGTLFLSDSSLFEKFYLLFDQGLDAFFYNRYSPALDKINIMSELDYFVGYGFGEKFYIPWFEYRENINNYSIQLDTAYLNFFSKYGLISFFVFLLPLLFFFNKNKKVAFCSVTVILIQYFTSSVYYHMAFLGFYICYIICLNVEKNE